MNYSTSPAPRSSILFPAVYSQPDSCYDAVIQRTRAAAPPAGMLSAAGQEGHQMGKANVSVKNRAAVLFVFLASVCFSTGGLFIKLIPWSALAINGARNLIGSAVIGIYLLITHHRLVFSGRVFIGAFSIISVTTLFTLANKMTTAANAIVLQFTAPIFVILLMALIYRQRPNRIDLLVCFLVLLGVVLFFVDGIRTGNLLGNVLAIVSGICYAGVFMMNTGKNADAISSSFLGQLTAGLFMAPLCAGETDFSFPTLAAVAALGIIQVGGAYILFSIGIRHTPAVTASLITGMEPILNPLLVAAFYGERVTALAAVGAVIVVCSILAYNVWLARKKPLAEQAETEAAGK